MKRDTSIEGSRIKSDTRDMEENLTEIHSNVAIHLHNLHNFGASLQTLNLQTDWCF